MSVAHARKNRIICQLATAKAFGQPITEFQQERSLALLHSCLIGTHTMQHIVLHDMPSKSEL